MVQKMERKNELRNEKRATCGFINAAEKAMATARAFSATYRRLVNVFSGFCGSAQERCKNWKCSKKTFLTVEL